MTKKRLEQLRIARGVAGGAYDDVLDFVAEHLVPIHGSAANATAHTLRASRAYKTWKRSKPRRNRKVTV